MAKVGRRLLLTTSMVLVAVAHSKLHGHRTAPGGLTLKPLRCVGSSPLALLDYGLCNLAALGANVD
jgi:hypothetical protein